ncbi:NAD(P)H-dependent oxidoreductase [Streptomyces sp. NPDC003077]|uniref:FMN-dependent NADH-azoreductase n=1 Tax=Streptomyces sp. NPDC003077 TaxID=3154443 RepID=UPI0033B94884
MTSLLHLDAGATHTGDSVSRQLTSLFADTWRELHGPDAYRYRDLAADPVPPIGPAYVDLGVRVERRGVVPAGRVAALTEGQAERREWALTLPLITELMAADTVLIGAPMYNLSVPAFLKAWIDRVSFPGAFTDLETGNSLLSGTRVVVVVSRGGGHRSGSPRAAYDFHTPYLRAYFTALGVHEECLHFVHAEFTRAGDIPELAQFQGVAANSLTAARDAVVELAARPVGAIALASQ